jgi:hypothetical protein
MNRRKAQLTIVALASGGLAPLSVVGPPPLLIVAERQSCGPVQAIEERSSRRPGPRNQPAFCLVLASPCASAAEMMASRTGFSKYRRP